MKITRFVSSSIVAGMTVATVGTGAAFAQEEVPTEGTAEEAVVEVGTATEGADDTAASEESADTDTEDDDEDSDDEDDFEFDEDLEDKSAFFSVEVDGIPMPYIADFSESDAKGVAKKELSDDEGTWSSNIVNPTNIFYEEIDANANFFLDWAEDLYQNEDIDDNLADFADQLIDAIDADDESEVNNVYFSILTEVGFEEGSSDDSVDFDIVQYVQIDGSGADSVIVLTDDDTPDSDDEKDEDTDGNDDAEGSDTDASTEGEDGTDEATTDDEGDDVSEADDLNSSVVDVSVADTPEIDDNSDDEDEDSGKDDKDKEDDDDE